MTRVFNLVGVGSAAVYLIVLPFAHTAALRSISLVVALVAAAAAWRLPSRAAMAVLAGLAVWLLAAALSLASTRNLQASLGAIENDVIRSCLVFLVFYLLPGWRGGALAASASLLLLSALAVSSAYATGDWGGHYVPSLGDYATSVITALPLLAGYWLLLWRERRIAWLPGAAMLAVPLAGYYTFSRAFGLVLMFAALLGTGLYAWQRRRLGKRLLVFLVIVCAVGLALALAATTRPQRSLLDDSGRMALYSAVAQKVAHNPITGTGYGHETDKQWYAGLPHWRPLHHAHNIVLSYLDQMGVFGLAALLAVFGVPAVLFARRLRAPAPHVRIAALCGLTMVGAVFLRNNLDYFFVKQNLWMFFAHLGIYLAAMDAETAATADRTSPTEMSRTSRLAG